MAQLSRLALTSIPSEIIRQGNEINERIANGERIFNFTIGDFNPAFFPIPKAFEEAIIEAYQHHATNYPPAAGILVLRAAVHDFIEEHEGLAYDTDEILIASGGRPLIYAAYRTIVDKGDKVVYPVPSWNNNHYTHFVEGKHVVVPTKPENNFMPTAKELRPLLQDACLLSLCSPLNPTGTVFSREELDNICALVLEINAQRTQEQKPLYLLYDQIYWTLTFGEATHHHPVLLRPEMKPYTITIDGMSKAFCATGVRVGWAMGPANIISSMRGILSHIGTWSPMAEQVAAAQFLRQGNLVSEHLAWMKEQLHQRLQYLHDAIAKMNSDGLPISSIAPQGAMYLTVAVNILGYQTTSGSTITSTNDITAYLLDTAKLAMVPFKSFGADDATIWYRLSVGVCDLATIDECLSQLRDALRSLKPAS